MLDQPWLEEPAPPVDYVDPTKLGKHAVGQLYKIDSVGHAYTVDQWGMRLGQRVAHSWEAQAGRYTHSG